MQRILVAVVLAVVAALAPDYLLLAQQSVQPRLLLPYPAGTQYLCTQGPGGAFSHRGNSKNDFDFDTPNVQDDLVVAAASGVAYVHADRGPSSYGNHVNIDHGNGYFSVYAHLKSFLVRDGQDVVVGDAIGIEDSTGFSTGDHLHFGLHTGDARQNVSQSVSVPIHRIVVADASVPGAGFVEVSGSDLVCADMAGHIYRSNNTLNPDAVDDDNYRIVQGSTLVAPSAGAPSLLDNDIVPSNFQSITFIGAPAGFTDMGGGGFSYTPPPGVVGTIQFAYSIHTATVDSLPAVVKIRVDPLPSQPPSAADDSYATVQGAVLTVQAPGVLGNDTAPPGATIEFLPPFPSTGLTNIAPYNGGFILDMSLNPTFTGTIPFRYVIHSISGDSNVATVTINVTPAVGPSLASTVPTSITAGPVDQRVLFLGTGFQQGLTMSVGRPGGGTSTVSGTQIVNVAPTAIEALITFDTPGTYTFTAMNPDGGMSEAFSLIVTAQSPSSITFRATGRVLGISESIIGSAPTDISIGSVVTLTYTFDPNAPPAQVNPPAVSYNSIGTPFGMDALVSGHAYTSADVTIQVLRDIPPPGFPMPAMLQYVASSSVGNERSFTLGLTNAINSDALTSTALPLTPPDLNLFATRELYVFGFSPSGAQAYEIAASLDSLTIIPSPLVPGLPTIAMYEGPSVWVWNEVDNATARVNNVSVCKTEVCGSNGGWRTGPPDRLLNGRPYPNGHPGPSTYTWGSINASALSAALRRTFWRRPGPEGEGHR